MCGALAAFLQMDVEFYIGQARSDMGGARSGPVPVLRLYGVTEDGHSVLTHVHGFHPYLYVPAPPGFTPEDCAQFRVALDAKVQGRVRSHNDTADRYVLNVAIEQRETVFGYHGGRKVDFLQIFVTLPAHVSVARRALEDGFDFNGSGARAYQTYESNIDFELRFLIDTGILGCNWIELSPRMYLARSAAERTSHCQYEFDVAWDLLTSHKPEDNWIKLAPLRILSFDIECAGRKGVFPEAEVDPVIQIASLVTIHGQAEPIIKNVFVLNTCAPITGASVYSFETESQLLRAWREFVVTADVDLITGYNINNFDLPYLINRAAALGVTDFPFLGRVRGEKTTMRDTTFSSKAFGTRENKEIAISGRVQFDALKCVQRDHKLRSYTLNAVSATFLDEQKEDVHYSIISDLQHGNAETRRRLAVYCLKDAYLPQRLLDKLLALVNYVEMARVTGVPLDWLLTRGQQIKVISQLYRKAQSMDFVIPAMKVDPQGDDAYEGATVIDPMRGFYDCPIATLDFSSLYPSIMMAHNLCYTTLLAPANASKLAADEVIRTPTGALFVKDKVRKGLLPIILQELLDARKKAKKDMKNETDPFRQSVLNGRQLALKISANSVYGFTGATVGKLPCIEISSSVTAFGRQMIDQTKTLVEQHYTIANGFPHNAQVIYGDTDSVMVKFGYPDMASTIEIGQAAAKFVTEHFVRPISLEFEKVYYPFLLINKKRYTGLYWTNAVKPDKMDAKGIETVRRDNCRLVKNVVETCIHKILWERDVAGAVAYVKDRVRDLVQNKVDLFDLIISKQISKSEESYDNKQAHVELAKRLRERDAGSAPVMGDRVAYVIIKGAPGAKAYEKAEDPLYVLQNNIPIDTHYYLENQMRKPLERLFDAILDNVNSLFVGDHTRAITVATSSVGGMMKFAKKSRKCLGCKGEVPAENQAPICHYCKDRETELYVRELNKLRALELAYARHWTQCQNCQSSLHQDILCSNDQCPIFFARTKIKIDLVAAEERVKLFAYDW